jgi:phosphate/sulfate permease
MQNIIAMYWLLIPIVGMILALLLMRYRTNHSGSRRGTITGIIVTAAML